MIDGGFNLQHNCVMNTLKMNHLCAESIIVPHEA